MSACVKKFARAQRQPHKEQLQLQMPLKPATETVLKTGPETGPKNGTAERAQPQSLDPPRGPEFVPENGPKTATADTTNQNHLTMYDDF